MRADYLSGLLDLATYPDRQARRAAFRQSMAALSLAASSIDGPSPLDGIHPEALKKSIRFALSDGLFDDLSWLAPAAATVGLYEIAAALPLGPERRDFGRRVLAQLYAGNAATFVAVATRMAAGSARGLSAAGIRARVAICMALPSSAHVASDALALALASRRELARDWFGNPSTASLPERRLASRMLERAARAAVRRAMQGDDNALRLFRNTIASLTNKRKSLPPGIGPDPISSVFPKLLGDRETLVWRHAAAARGLLAGLSSELSYEITQQLGTNLSPTEWRRAATSLVASIAIDPERSLQRSLDLIRGPLLIRDPAIATAMVWGLRCAAEIEPEASEQLLDVIAETAPVPVAESVAELRYELGSFGARAAEHCKKALSALLSAPEPDEGLTALARSILRDLSSDSGEGSELWSAVRKALLAFVEDDSPTAYAHAQSALSLAAETIHALEALDVSDNPRAQSSMSRRAAASLLREIDTHLLENGLLQNLLLLDRPPSEDTAGVPALDDLYERLTGWLIRSEASAQPRGGPPPHVTFHQRKLRALLHLIDCSSTDFGDDSERRTRVRSRFTSASSVLVARLINEPKGPLRRAITATVARALDALVRDSAADAADILLFSGMHLGSADDLDVLAEASMHPDVTQLVQAYARFVRKLDHKPSGNDPARIAEHGIDSLKTLIAELPTGASQRIEVTTSALSRLTKALTGVASAGSLSALASNASTAAEGGSPLTTLDDALSRLEKLTTGARRRCGDDLPAEPSTIAESSMRGGQGSQPPENPLLVAIRRTINQPPADIAAEIALTLDDYLRQLDRLLPSALAGLIRTILTPILALPLERPSAPLVAATSEQSLPAWMPPRRTLGGFYVHRQLGGGSLGTVFVVTRAEERHDPHAERFALKVPDYDATAARSVSEADFLKLFREEAGALLSLPEHSHLARFVTFDAGAKPKPILVMELVEGARCDHLISSRGLTIQSAMALIDGILSGLEAMHSVGVGHLDIKPSNVILRAGKEAVLVDFGLAGRHIRPGCATAAYGAPEIWGIVPDGVTATPMTADIYAFGCLAFEVLTANILFDESSDIATVSAHLLHDGLPEPVRKLAQNPKLEPLGMFLFHCLRNSPADRPSAEELRRKFKPLFDQLKSMAWPIEVH